MLGADGSLEVKVEGLVLATTGANPIAQLQGDRQLRGDRWDDAAVTTNVSTGLVPRHDDRGFEDRGHGALPDPCFAPIVFVTSPGGSWFAVTGV